MKIQDMRSGILHLNKKMESERQSTHFKMGAATQQALVPEDARAADVASELDEPRWSLVSFDKHEAGGLTYRQAAALMAELDANRIHGLCIITDEAAKRYAS